MHQRRGRMCFVAVIEIATSLENSIVAAEALRTLGMMHCQVYRSHKTPLFQCCAPQTMSQEPEGSGLAATIGRFLRVATLPSPEGPLPTSPADTMCISPPQEQNSSLDAASDTYAPSRRELHPNHDSSISNPTAHYHSSCDSALGLARLPSICLRLPCSAGDIEA
ncbi:hypothetical protein BT67DRAFT_44254 [Trichocladium antarcticum]|uniref:Uncharacterized protein n=1 Tax=Trichocladium antarcticum TaxID=1450529 RepID=A0AAN6UJ38_9PEZI|nr:hypothetical protein BT67DRAFT_44254 [Trichocladium antarcticum]